MARPLAVTFRKLTKRLRPQKQPELVRVDDEPGGPGRQQEIPRIVYQTAESRFVHPSHAKSIAEFRGLNPDLGFQMFDAEERDEYMLSSWGTHPIAKVYERAVFGQMKADIFRYCIVFERGGYYFDFNKGCSAPLTSLHTENATGLVSYESNPELLFPDRVVAETIANPFNLVLQWGFGFTSHHPFLTMLINRIVEIEPYFRDQTFDKPKMALLTMSAPGVFTDVFRRFVGMNGLGGIEEAGVDFDGCGIFRLRGSKKTTRDVVYYGKLAGKKIVETSE